MDNIQFPQLWLVIPEGANISLHRWDEGKAIYDEMNFNYTQYG